MVLILSTGAIIGGFTLSTWDDLLEKARDTGDEGFGMCLDSGTADIETVSARYLRSVLGNVDTAVKEYLKVPEQLVVSLANLAQAHHPNISTSPAFAATVMRPAALSAYLAGSTSGLVQIGNEAYPWCAAHPVPWKRGDGNAGWGSRITYREMNPRGANLPANGSKVTMLYGTRHPVTLSEGLSDFAVFTEVNEMGDIRDPSLPCRFFPDYNKGDYLGLCLLPIHLVEPEDGDVFQQRRRQIYNLGANDPPLNPADTLVYSHTQVTWDLMWWELSYTYTHPDMYTMHPKQGKRVGVVTASVTASGVVDAVRAQLLPTGTSLYLVDYDSATDSVGTLVAYNRGRQLQMTIITNALGLTLPEASNINITNHSMEDATSHIPSVIAEHGRFVFTHPQNYKDLVEKTEDSFLKWSDSNGTEYWTITSTIEHKTIALYANLLVPRESVMHSIDASTNAIRAKVASDLSSADAQKEDAVTVMAIVTAVAVIGLLAIAVVFTRYITSPLLKLGSEMASVAVMDLEAVDTGRAVSQLSEVRVMQRSFVTMVANLVEYRNYLPQSVLVNDTENEMCRTETTHVTTSVSGTSWHSDGASEVVIENQKALLRVEGMKKKKVSLAHMNVVSWHAFCEQRKDEEVLCTHGSMIETILTAVLHNKGVCDTFAGDKILATFNAFAPSASHGVACVKAAHAAAKALSDVHLVMCKLSYGCTTGEARVGPMGCNGMKKVSILSESMSWVVVLERWNRMNDLPGVLDHSLSREVQGQVVLRCEGAMLYEKLSDKAQVVYAVKELVSMKNEEWMYQLEALEQNNPHTLWNEAFAHIIAQEFSQAACVLDSLGAEQLQQYDTLVRYVQQRAFTPYVVNMH